MVLTDRRTLRSSRVQEKAFKYKTVDRVPKRVTSILEIRNSKGLHTRPSTELVRCAGRFQAQIRLIYRGVTVNAKSLLGVLMLAAPKGARMRVEAVGEDAQKAVESLLTLAESKFKHNY